MLLQKSPSLPRSLRIDALKVIAMTMVLMLHTIYNFTLRPDFFATKLWFIIEIISAFSKPAVLIFFIISGYLSLTKQTSIQKNASKLLKRLVTPLIFFSSLSLLYLYYQSWLSHVYFSEYLFLQFKRITDFPSSTLWFLEVLVIFTLLNPLWQSIFSDNKKKDLAIYLTKITFLFILLSQFESVMTLKASSYFNHLTGWLGYIALYFYGGLIRNNWTRSWDKIQSLSLISVGVIATMIGDYLTSYSNHHTLNLPFIGFANLLSIPGIMIAVGVFNLIIGFRINNNTLLQNTFLRQLIHQIATHSFGIYLIHPLVINFLSDFAQFSFDELRLNVYVYNLLNFSLVFGISMLLTNLIKRSRWSRWSIGE